MMVAFVRDDDGFEVVASVDDPMADVHNLRAVYASLFFQIVQKVRECGGMVVDGVDGLFLGFTPRGMRGEREGERGGGCRDVRDIGDQE